MDKPLIATSSSSSNKRKRKTENAVPTSSTSTNGHGGSGISSNPKGPTGRNNAKSHDNTIAPVEGTVNPFSHSPSTIEQFALAGLSIDNPVPSRIHPHFPHKPIPEPRPRQTQQFVDPRVEGVAERRAWAAKHKKDANAHFFQAEVDDAASIAATTTDDEDDAATTSADENENEEELQVAHEKSFGPLLEIIRKSLTERDIVTAKMAFGLLINSEIGGRVVDLRYPGYWDSGFVEYWKLGLEILQTEVEVAEQEQKGNKSGLPDMYNVAN
ncbi:hypothetical protein QBC37DRAFT_389459 [Rhypophila decipiens]|uniref:Uncharacterized protein n=1 Tax=Rhypophila decipiens TaxID=261697 RepID=A0AAN6Y5G3_9PEZI|nr:hypothetical protein QBC37DRAFT_389459 [Rhypophila decipiens]